MFSSNPLIFFKTHERGRERCIRSHLKYMRFMKNGGTMQDFQELISYFIFGYAPKSRAYCTSVCNTLACELKRLNPSYQKPFKLSMITSAYRRAAKLNRYDAQILYLSDGSPIAVEGNKNKEGLRINENPKVLPWNNAKKIHDLAEKTLAEFLIDPNKLYSSEVELMLLIDFLYKTGRRKNEILSLTMNQVRELIENEKTEIKTKTKTTIMCIPSLFTHTLNAFVNHPSRAIYKNFNRLFITRYEKLRLIYIGFYKKITGVRPDRGVLFHAWRNNFSVRASAVDPRLAQNALGHGNKMSTLNYVNKQMLHDTDLQQILLNQLSY